MTNRKLIKSTGVIGSATVASRILGFVRDILFAKLFGTNIFAQAFVVAFRLPNMLRDMVGEGATDAAIVPILTEYKHTRSEKEYWEVARIIQNLMLIMLIIVAVLGILFAPLLVRIIAPGFIRTPEKFQLTVSMTRMVFPYILFLGMVAYCKGVLNSLQYFTTPALAPVVLNITMITSLFVLCPHFGVKGLIAGILLGAFFEVVIQIPPLMARGFKFKREFNLFHPITRRIGKLLLPRAMGTAVYQLSVLVDTVLASLSWVVGPGGVAALYYSNRLVQLPLAVFGISLATAALPKMAKEVASGEIGQLKETISFSLRTVFTVMLPAGMGLMILSTPIVRILFQRGEFSAYSTSITAYALLFYTFGLFAYAGIKILVGTFFSMGDTKTPVKTAAFSLALNLVLNLLLMWPMKIGGLALATSISAGVNFIILYILLGKRIGDIGTRKILSSLMKISVSTVIMGIFTYLAGKAFLRQESIGNIVLFLRLIAVITVSFVIYAVSAYSMKVEGVRKIYVFVREKMKNNK